MLKKTLRNQKGFTLIEIIAVLVILGILAAVAVPKYMDLQGEARNKSAMAAVSEAKARLSSAYAKAVLVLGGANTTSPTYQMVYDNGNFTANSWGDYNVTVTATDGTISVDKVQTKALSPAITNKWDLPTTN